MNFVKIKTNNSELVKPIKSYLESIDALNKDKKISKEDGVYSIHTKLENTDKFEAELVEYASEIRYGYYPFQLLPEPDSLTTIVKNYFTWRGLELDKDLEDHIPKKWSIYRPLLLFGSDTFDSKVWQDKLATMDDTDFFSYILSNRLFVNSRVSNIAINKPIIESDVMRRPFNIKPLFGDFGPPPSNYDNPTEFDFMGAFWCTVVQNGIFQTWAPYYTMFSRGNIKEKARILDTYKDLKQSVVFDLYCGIGYFSLSYLKNGAKHLFCWELNPWSVEGFRRAIEYKYAFKIFKRHDKFNYDIFLQEVRKNESNEYVLSRLETFPKHQLPIAHGSWDTTRELIKHHSSIDSTIAHIHENVHQMIMSKFDTTILPTPVKVKTFAPDIWHVVFVSTIVSSALRDDAEDRLESSV
ncbi:S-adenosyl-L-methionine-dependent methyltransferase [Scheffersomyces xylosifermentans]|uniref:S-adenosyl-L-methionine-dependent methyltransferase n=1 Tax=Scheffersomyces xylosifermentans TaxID=1304137 RepID=UPI00315C567E